MAIGNAAIGVGVSWIASKVVEATITVANYHKNLQKTAQETGNQLK